MASPFARCARSACGVAVFALFVACGGASDPGLFSASSGAGSAGVSNHAGASSDGGAAAHAGSTSKGGASSSGGGSEAGAGSTDGGAANGGASAAGSSGAAQAGASNNAGADAGGSANGGAANGGSAGSLPNAGSGGSDDETCQTLFAKASKQLAAAQVCNLAADAQQCTGTVKNSCKCEVPVNREESAETKAYEATSEQLDKKKCVQLCSALACLSATHAVCKASALGSTAGTCVASYAQPL
jgi:hypothetical protein